MSFSAPYKHLEFGRALRMTKLLLLCFGIMFSLYGYDHLSDGSLTEEPAEMVEASQEDTPTSFTERISQKRKS